MNRFLQLNDELVKQSRRKKSLVKAKSLSQPGHNYSGQFYDTGEHVLAGENILCSLQPGYEVYIQSVPFTYSQIIALADLYLDVNQMMNSKADELKRLKALIVKSTNFYKHKLERKTGPPADINPGNADWQRETGKRYLKLADDNYEHFAPLAVGTPGGPQGYRNHKMSWEYYHKAAIDEVGRAFLAAPKAKVSAASPSDLALILNAFGDHFLTDAFASGHLVNKGQVIEKFKSRFLKGNKVTADAEAFFDSLAKRTFKDEVARKFSKLETTAKWVTKIPVLDRTPGIKDAGFHPNIDSAGRFKDLFIKAMEEEPDTLANIAVKAIHDDLNKKGVRVENKKGKPWQLFGDENLNTDTLNVMRNAVCQSINNLYDPSILANNLNYGSYFQKVWDYTPRLAAASVPYVNSLVDDLTNPKSTALLAFAIKKINDDVDLMIDTLVIDKKKLRPE